MKTPSKSSPLLYTLLALFLGFEILRDVLDLWILPKIFRQLSIDSEDMIYIGINMVLGSILKGGLIFGLVKMKKFVPLLAVLLFVGKCSNYLYVNFIPLRTTTNDQILLGALPLLIIGGLVLFKIIKDREYFRN